MFGYQAYIDDRYGRRYTLSLSEDGTPEHVFLPVRLLVRARARAQPEPIRLYRVRPERCSLSDG
jgi:hypothetical protein